MIDLADQISKWIAQNVHDAGAKGTVVGLSGGIDSAVTATLCKKALGTNVLGVIMPCESDPNDEEDALLITTKLGIMTITVRLDETYQALVAGLSDGTRLANANLKTRLRMAILYFLANTLSYLVIGTGNKTELMVGYFTKYGDGGVDILPLGGLYKTQVWELARALNIPERIINKKPSAGLWPGQSDEEELGISYSELDRTLQAINARCTDSIPQENIRQVWQLVESSVHKRRPAPVFEAVTDPLPYPYE
ncbi:MAG: NAD+ synthase [Kiritimatiellia bacterium]|nr:NAD+ synthase [Kiritimatiellia bacterium]